MYKSRLITSIVTEICGVINGKDRVVHLLRALCARVGWNSSSTLLPNVRQVIF